MPDPAYLTAGRTGSWTNSGNAAQGWNWGVTGTVATSGFLRSIRWYRQSTASNAAPSRLQVWDRTTQGLIANVSAVPDNGAVGWQEYLFTVDIPLFAGREYTASCWVDAGDLIQHTPFANRGTPQSPWSFAASPAHTSPNANWDYPSNVYANVLPNVDLSWSATGGGGGTDPGQAEDFAGELAATFSVDDNTRQTWLPWLTKEVLDTFRSEQSAAEAATAAKLGTDANIGGSTWGNIMDAVEALGLILGVLQPGDESAVRAANDAAIRAQQASDQATAAVEALNTAYYRDRSLVGSTGWTAGVVVVHQGTKLVMTNADAFRLHIANWGSARRFNTYDGIDLFTQPFWWAPVENGYTGNHTTFMTKDTLIRRPGYSFQGVLISVDPDIEWSLTPWTFTG